MIIARSKHVSILWHKIVSIPTVREVVSGVLRGRVQPGTARRVGSNRRDVYNPRPKGHCMKPEFLETCERAARIGGQILLDWQGRFKVQSKGPKDVVTEADLASQNAIRDTVLGRFPEHEFLGEEDCGPASAPSVTTRTDRRPYRWIVDPLDGTSNYVRGLPAFAVSVALEVSGEIVVAAVFDPTLNECFTGAAGQGAWLNGRRLHSSSCPQLSEAMVAASFAADVRRGSPEIEQFVEMLHRCHSLRRLGSAALNLCYVAAGRMDAYWSTSCKAWDVAAGVLLVREAGGVITDVDGRAFDIARPVFAASANATLHREFLQVLNVGTG